MANYIKYVERGGEQSFPVPYLLKNAHLWAFLLKADQSQLQELCDEYLNRPRLANPRQSIDELDFRYCVQTDLVVLFVDTVEEAQSSSGSFAEPAELIFWIIARVEKRKGDQFVFERFVFFSPYIFLAEAATAIATGREVYGLTKELGWFTVAIDENDLKYKHLRLSVLAFNKGEDAKKREVLQIERLYQKLNLFDLGDLSKELAEELLEEFSIPIQQRINLIPVIKDLLEEKITMVTLKQFRDVEPPMDKACYQAIVEAPFSVTQIRDLELPTNRFQVIVRDFYSHPIVSDLGLKGEKFGEADGTTAIKQKALFAYKLSFDFKLDWGRVIWQASEIESSPDTSSALSQSENRPLCQILAQTFLQFAFDFLKP